ncbi:MAG: fatty acid/phospholipid synthesis protein PlsX [Bacteroidetes bacterium]|nr:fatty acid/phospholipid synthesis protein PlsX [Bacteroidota bacterium]MBS1233475.1 fatty acid/phospholipid synthesis protein PlsX [Bacteroidota bacterium]
MRIGIDIMGGDYAPEAIMLGSALAFKELPENIRLVLIGDENQITSICRNHSIPVENFEIVHATQQIGMGDHPIKSFSQKTDSSIVVGFRMLKEGRIDSFASAGNTGAMLVGAMQVIKSVPGIIRPAIAAAIPRLTEKPILLLDVGLNPDCRPDVLYQYAILGKIYARDVFGISEPRIGLLNIGSEDEKGNLLTKSTFQAMKDTTDFTFYGNVEGNDLFGDKVDVIICDGFIGNVMLKEAEAFYSLIRKRKIQDPFFEKFNFVHYGGTPVLGVNAPVLIAHGISNDIAIKNLIRQSIDVVKADIAGKIKEAFK